MIKILLLDVETSPNLAFLWKLWGDQHVSLSQLVESSRIICWSAKWHGEKKTHFRDHRDPDMVTKIYELVSEADAVCTYNGKRFDMPALNTEFLLNAMTPPPPYKQIDLYHVVRSKFKLPSNKLAYITEKLGLSGKLANSGFDLWVKCMAGEKKAWREMKKYSIRDTVVLEELYDVLLPWIEGHPNRVLYDADAGCPACASHRRQRRGFYHTPTRKFQQYRCNDCGRYYRDTKSIPGSGVDVQAAR